MKKSIIKLIKKIIKFLKFNKYNSRINSVKLNKNGNIIKKAGPIFKRDKHLYNPKDLLNRESNFIKILEGNHIPKLISQGDNWIELEYCGLPISKENIPNNWNEQLIEISDLLSKHKVIHRDIKEGNLLVKDSSIYLIDFGWAIFEYEKNYLSPREISGISRKLIYNNYFAMQNLIDQLL